MKLFSRLCSLIFILIYSFPSIGQDDLSVYYNCHSNCIEVNVFGGVSPYQVDWLKWDEINNEFLSITNWPKFDLSGEDNQEDLCNIQNLGAGTYLYIVIDDLCGKIEGEVIVPNLPPDLSLSTTASCDDDGSITSEVNYGKSPYTYLWNDGTTSANRDGLQEGFFELTVTDFNGCSASASTYVKDAEPIDLESMFVVINNTNCTTSDGYIELKTQPTGGNPPFHYFWSNGYEGMFNGDLTSGIYHLTVVDVEGCTNSKYFTVLGEGQPSIIAVGSENTCSELSNGEITIIVVPEVGPLSYSFPPDVNYNVIEEGYVKLTDLEAGSYCVTITDDSNGCYTEICEIIEVIDDYIEFTGSSSVQHSCNFEPNGSIYFTANGGVGERSYNWSNGATTNAIFDLYPGNFSVTVTDECNNVLMADFEVQGTIEDMNVDSKVYCVSKTTGIGKIDLTVTGSNGPYSYFWSNNTYEQDLIVTNSGIYTVKIVDSNGCNVVKAYEIGDTEDDFEAHAIISELTNCEDRLQVKVTVNVSGGQQPYSFDWVGGGTGNFKVFEFPLSSIPSPINYNVEVTDNCNSSIILFSEVRCEDLCNEECISLRKTGSPACVDICGDALIIELGCDKFKVECNCDDEIERVFHWNSILGTSGITTTFIGSEPQNENQYDVKGSGPGYVSGLVENKITGCVRWESLFVPEKCFSLLGWLSDNAGSGTFSGNDLDPPNNGDPGCIEWDVIENEDCSFTWKCIDPPNTYPDVEEQTIEYCTVTYDGSSEVTDLELLYESCDCDWIGNLHIAVGDYDEYCPCSSQKFSPIDTITNNVKCLTNPKDIYFNYNKNSYVYLTTKYGVDSVVYGHVTYRNASIDTLTKMAPIIMEDGTLEGISLDSNRNIILHSKTLNGYDKVIKYDSIGQVLWEYKFAGRNSSKVYIHSDVSDFSTLIATYSNSIVKVVVNELGDVISHTEQPTYGEYYYSQNSFSYINVKPFSSSQNEITYSNSLEGINWDYNIPKEIEVVKYYEDINKNLLIYYNYRTAFSMNGNSISLHDKISSGVLKFSSTGQYIENIIFNIAKNLIITDVAKGFNNEYALIGYYSNSEIHNCTYFYDNYELCSFLINFRMDENDEVGSRKEVNTLEYDLLIYPNPTSTSQIELRLNKGNDTGILTVYDNFNNLIYKERDVEISMHNSVEVKMENLNSGVYILNFEGKESNTTKKVIFIK